MASIRTRLERLERDHGERQWRIVLLPADTPQAEIDALLADGRTQVLLGVDANKVLGVEKSP